MSKRSQVLTCAEWMYVFSGGRDLRLDLVRGYAVFAMIVDHVGGDSPSRLYVLTGGDQFFVSAAEIFVFVSGVTVGLVYGRRALESGWRRAALKLVERAWTLYALAVWMTIATATLDALLRSPDPALVESPGRFVLTVIAVRRTYYLVDVMLLYAMLMFVAPAAMALLLRRRWWLVLGASCGLWAAYQLWPNQLQDLPWPIANNDLFHLAAWQVLFFTGMVIGFQRASRAHRLASDGRLFVTRSVSPETRSYSAGSVGSAALASRPGWFGSRGRLLEHSALAFLLILFGGLVWLYQTDGAMFDRLGPWTAEPNRLQTWFDKASLPPARLAACAVVFALGWLLLTRFWRPLHAVLGRALLPLGEAALYAWAVHVFLASVVTAAEIRVWGANPILPGSLNLVIQLGTVAAVWGLTRIRFLKDIVSPLGRPPFHTTFHSRLGGLPVVPTGALGAMLAAAACALAVVLIRG